MTVRLLGIGWNEDSSSRSIEPFVYGQCLSLYATEGAVESVPKRACQHLRDVADLAAPAPFLGFRLPKDRSDEAAGHLARMFCHSETRLAGSLRSMGTKAEVVVTLRARSTNGSGPDFLRAAAQRSRSFDTGSHRLGRTLSVIDVDGPLDRVGETMTDSVRKVRRDVLRTDRSFAQTLVERLCLLAEEFAEEGGLELTVRGPWPVFIEPFGCSESRRAIA